MLEVLRAGSLVGAVMTIGIVAGVFQVYSYAIMPGLRRTDDRTFVEAFQQIDRAIINPLFMSTFFGALILAAAASALHTKEDVRPVLPWTAAAFGMYLAVVIITMAVHVPLNDHIKAAGDPSQIGNLSLVRDEFHEGRWVAWNIVRAVLSTGALGCLAWALVVYGRQ